MSWVYKTIRGEPKSWQDWVLEWQTLSDSDLEEKVEMNFQDKMLASVVSSLCESLHENARDKGFWDDVNERDPRHLISLVGLIMSEGAEAIEAIRKEDQENFEEELADIAIRVFDVAGGLRIDLGAAIVEKMTKNKNRPHKHGKVC